MSKLHKKKLNFHPFIILAFALILVPVSLKTGIWENFDLARLVITFFFGISFSIGLILTIQDFKEHSISAALVYVLATFVGFFNLAMFVFTLGEPVELTHGEYYVPMVNLITGGIAAFFIWLIVFFSKEQAMGFGDILMYFIAGNLVGGYKFIVGFYVTILAAMIYGLFLAIKNKKIHGIELPFVPFIFLGTFVGFLLTNQTVIGYFETLFSLN